MNAEDTAAEFRRAVEAGDPDALEALLAEHVVLRSPAVHTPYGGIDLIRVDADGLIDDLRVLVRPLSGINTLVARMGAEIPRVMTEVGLG